MIWINEQFRRLFASPKKKQGLFLVELMIVLGLLSVVLSIGYMLFSFGYNSFFMAQARSDVQQNVRIAANFISDQVRHATEATLLDSSHVIPAAGDIASENIHYIFLNGDGKMEYRTKGHSLLIPSVISDRIDFDLDFFISASSNQILAFNVDGLRDTGQTYSLTSEIFLENLAFRNISITTVGTEYKAVRFIKEPSTTLIAMSVEPNMVAENPYVTWNYSFELALLNSTFTSDLENDINSIVLGDDFSSMSVLTVSVNNMDSSKATIVLTGVLARDSGTGFIRVLPQALSTDTALEARVLITIPVGILTAIPNPVYASEFIDEDEIEFTMEVYNNSFITSVATLEAQIQFGGDLSNLKIKSLERLSSTRLSIRVGREDINIPLLGNEEGVGFIMMGGDGFFTPDSEALTASLIVYGADVTPKNTLSVSYRGQGGTVPAPGIYYFSAGESKTFTANPADYWSFLKWVIAGEEETEPAVTKTLGDSNVSAVAHFRLYLDKVPRGSYVRYGTMDYIVLSPIRLMDKAQSSNTFSWGNYDEWPTYAELDQLTRAQRGGAGNYWTSTAVDGNTAYWVDNNGDFQTRNKNNSLSRRLVVTLDVEVLDKDYYETGYESGNGTAFNPYRLPPE